LLRGRSNNANAQAGQENFYDNQAVTGETAQIATNCNPPCQSAEMALL
jgi:hypothetical protein